MTCSKISLHQRMRRGGEIVLPVDASLNISALLLLLDYFLSPQFLLNMTIKDSTSTSLPLLLVSRSNTRCSSVIYATSLMQ